MNSVLQGHCWPPGVLWGPAPADPSTVSVPTVTPHCAAAEEHEVCSQTSLLYCGCKMEAGGDNTEPDWASDHGDRWDYDDKHVLFHSNLPGRTASQTAQHRAPTSPLLGCRGGLVAPREPGTLGFHRMYASSHQWRRLPYRDQSRSALHDHHCPAGCSLVWGL